MISGFMQLNMSEWVNVNVVSNMISNSFNVFRGRTRKIYCVRPKPSNPSHSKSKRADKMGSTGHTCQHKRIEMVKNDSVHLPFCSPAKRAADQPYIYQGN